MAEVRVMALPTASITKSKLLSARGGAARVEGRAAGVLLQRRAAQRVDLGHLQVGHAVVAQQQRGQHADGAAAEHQHAALGQRAHEGAHREVDRVHRGGRRFGQRAGGGRQVVGQRDQALAGNAHALGKGAGPCHADHRAVRAQVVAALQAPVAAAAGDQRVAGDTLAGQPQRRGRLDHRGGELVAEHQPGFAARVVAVVGVHVRAADAGGVDAQHHFVIGKLGLGAVVQLDLIGGGVDEGFHGFSSRCSRRRPSASGR
jgi:hypothetical protein